MVMQGVQGEVLDDPPPGSAVERVQPSGVRYSTGAIPLATPAKSACRKFYPSNGREFSPANTKVIQLPLAAEGQFLDAAGHSFLKFDLEVSMESPAGVYTLNDKVQACLSCPAGAMAVIRRMRILSATGQQLEDIEDYNALQALMIDLQVSNNYLSSHLKTRAGCGPSVTQDVPTSSKTSPLLAALSDTFTATAGASGVISGIVGTKTYSINLMSGLLQQTKYLPLLATKGGIQIELTLEDTANVFTCPNYNANNKVSYKLKNVEYIAELIDFGPEFNMRFLQMLQAVDGVRMSGTTFRTHVGSFDNGGPNPTLSISERARSIKSIFTIMRSNHKYGSQRFESIGDRAGGGNASGGVLSSDLQYQYRVGSLTYPDHPIEYKTYHDANAVQFYVASGKHRNASEALSQAYKAVGGALTDVSADSLITGAGFARGAPDTYADLNRGDLRGQFVAAMSFESTTQDTAMLESGLNSAAQALPIEIKFTGSTAPMTNTTAHQAASRVNAYVMCDCIFTFLPNGEVQCSV